MTTPLASMRGHRVYLDTNCLIYFFIRDPDYFQAAFAILNACKKGEIIGMFGQVGVAELLVKPYQNNDATQIAQYKKFLFQSNTLQILPHDLTTFEMAAQIRAQQGVKLIDALHYATALNGGCRFFLSNDHAFKSTPRMEVLRMGDFSGEKP